MDLQADMSYLEGAALEVFLDVGGKILILLHVLLHADLTLELRNELLLDCDRIRFWILFFP